MKQSKKIAIVLTLVSLFLIALAIPSYSWTRTNVSRIEKFYNSKLSPIIMIPGSSATENRFDGFGDQAQPRPPRNQTQST